jgi:hypothetical protein
VAIQGTAGADVEAEHQAGPLGGACVQAYRCRIMK